MDDNPDNPRPAKRIRLTLDPTAVKMNPAPLRKTNQRKARPIEQCKPTETQSDVTPSVISPSKLEDEQSRHKRSLLDCPSEILVQIVSYLDTGHNLEIDPMSFSGWHLRRDPITEICIPHTPLLALGWSCKTLHSYARPLLCKYSADLKKFHELLAKPKTYTQVLSVRQADKSDYGLFQTGPTRKLARESVVQELLEMERWPAYDPQGMSEALLGWTFDGKEQDAQLKRFGWKSKHESLFTCTRCLRFRPVNKFVVAQVTGRRGKRPKSSQATHQANERFCIDCGMHRERCYSKGALYRFFDKDITDRPSWGIVCLRCGKWKVCEGGRDGKEAANKTCQECLEYRPKGRLTTPTAPDGQNATSQGSTTQEPTTQEATTQEPTTQELTTQDPTTQESTTA